MLSTRPLNVPSSVLRKPSKSTTTTTAALDNNKENNDFSSPKIQFLGKTPSFAGGRKSLKTGGATTSTAAKTITTIKASTKKTSTSSSSPSSASVKKVQQQPLVPLPTNKRLLTLRDITNTSTPKSSTNRNTTTTNPSKKLSQTLKKSVAPKTLLAASVEDLQDIEYMPPRSIPLSTCAPVYDVSSAEIDLDALTKSVTSSFHPFIPRAISSRPHQSLEELADVSNLELELNSTYATDDGGVDELDFKFDALDVSETYDLLLL